MGQLNIIYLWQDKHPGPESADSVILYEARDTEWVVEAVGVECVHELREGPGGAHDGEHGQEHAPPRQRTPEVECRPEMIVKMLRSCHAVWSLVTCWPCRSGPRRWAACRCHWPRRTQVASSPPSISEPVPERNPDKYLVLVSINGPKEFTPVRNWRHKNNCDPSWRPCLNKWHSDHTPAWEEEKRGVRSATRKLQHPLASYRLEQQFTVIWKRINLVVMLTRW